MSAHTFNDIDLFGDILGDLTPENPVVVIPADHGRIEYQEPSGSLNRAFPDNQFPWPPKLCIDFALGLEDEETILLRYGITPEEFNQIKHLDAFRRDLAQAAAAIREEGLTFKTKCKLFAEEYLEELYLQLFDKSLGASTRFDMFKKLVQLGGLEPKPEKADVNSFDNLPRVAIQINL